MLTRPGEVLDEDKFPFDLFMNKKSDVYIQPPRPIMAEERPPNAFSNEDLSMASRHFSATSAGFIIWGRGHTTRTSL